MNYFQPQQLNGEENIQNNLPGKMLNHYFQPTPQPDYSSGFFAGGPEGETGGPGGYYQMQQEQLPDNSHPHPIPQQFNQPDERIGGFFPGSPNEPGPAFPVFPPEQMGDSGFPSPPDNTESGFPFLNWPPAPSFPTFPGGGSEGPQQQPGLGMGGMGNQPPTSPPPNFVPQKQNVQTFAVDPGGIRHCRFRFTYIWPHRSRGFWAFPTFVGRNSIAGFRWNGFRWVYFGMDLNSIESFQCM